MARILIADDSSFMRLMLKEILTQLGHSVSGEAADGQEAVALYAELGLDLVTMDLSMPHMDGLAAIRWLKDLHPQSRVVVCSAHVTDAVVQECGAYGVRDFIVKPFHADHVATAIASALA